MVAVGVAWETSFGGEVVKVLVGFGLALLVGLVGLYLLISLSGVEGWFAFGGLMATVTGGAGLWILAREGLKAEAGYRRWRNAVWAAQSAVNGGDMTVRMSLLVSVLNDPVLTETYESLLRANERELERKQNGGDHSGR